VHKGSTQTNKRSKLGFKSKVAKESRVPWSSAPDCPVCHRTVSCAPGPYKSKLATFGFLRACSAIIHRTVRCATGLSGAPAEQRLPAQRSTATDTCKRYSAQTERAEVRAAARGAPDSEQYLSGAAPDCPVPQEDKAPTVDCARTLTVGWRGWRTGQCPVAHWTVRCAHRQQPLPTVVLVVEGYKYPQPPPLQPSKHSSLIIQYKSKVQHSKTQIKATDPIKVPNSIHINSSYQSYNDLYLQDWPKVILSYYIYLYHLEQDIEVVGIKGLSCVEKQKPTTWRKAKWWQHLCL
jgi:hypothetical protein